MMKEYLLFQLYSPMVSWGEEAVGEIRHSSAVPTRSALLGLLAAAVGIRRDEETQINAFNQAYHFAVHALSRQESWLRDYHTVSAPRESKKLRYFTRRDELCLAPEEVSTLISQREYRCDGYWHIAVSAKPDAPYTLAELRNALLAPCFTLYLGRKSCPLGLPLSPQIFEGTLNEVLVRAASSPLLQPSELDGWLEQSGYCYWDDLEEDSLCLDKTLHSNNQPLSRSRWQFGSYTRLGGTLKGRE